MAKTNEQKRDSLLETISVGTATSEKSQNKKEEIITPEHELNQLYLAKLAKRQKIQTGISLPAELMKKVELDAFHEGSTKSSVIEKCISFYFENRP